MTWKKIFQALQVTRPKKTDDLVLLVTFVISEGVGDLLQFGFSEECSFNLLQLSSHWFHIIYQDQEDSHHQKFDGK